MTGKAHLVDVKDTPAVDNKKGTSRTLRLVSGREIKVSAGKNEDLLEIFESKGEMVLKVRLTEDGPVMVVEGCRLSLNSSKAIALRAPTIEISAEEKALIESKGELKIDSVKEMGIHSDDDIRVVGKIIHLN